MAQLIRTPTLEDAPQLARVHVHAWQVAYADLLPADFLASLSVDQREQRWRQILAAHENVGRQLVAEIDGTVVGFSTVGPSRDEGASPTTGELWALYVSPEHWRQGIGHTLHEHALRHLSTEGYAAATLWVLDANVRAERFYVHHGWKRDGHTKTEHRGDICLTEVRYARSLTS